MAKHNRAFTLVEVMVATAVLSMGILLVYQSYFTVLRAFDYYVGYLASNDLLNEKLWEASDSVRRDRNLGNRVEGDFSVGGRNFTWQLSQDQVSQTLAKVTCVIRWKAGQRQFSVARSEYAAYEKIPD